MLYWLENVNRCPEDGYKFKKPSKYVRHNSANNTSLAVYKCPGCGRTYIEYPGPQIASSTNISSHFLSDNERYKIKSYKEESVIEERRAAWAAKQTRDQLEKQRIEDRKRLEEEAERERRRRLLAEYTTDEIIVTDDDLFSRATAILKKLYGEDARFRPGQYEAIERTIKEKRLLVVQKTGWGKSLVYFICTKLLREDGAGVTLVISPLLALMDNQLMAAKKMGLTCESLNSTASYGKKELILTGMVSNTYDLILTTPESLMGKTVRQYLPEIKIGLLVIDEAHCISDWGHDFRLEYSRIYKVIEKLQPNVPVLATTATANDIVIKDLSQQMGVPNISRGHLMRDNLSIQVLDLPDKEARYAWLLDNLPRLPGTGIIYCLSRKDCSWLSEFLRENGVLADPYFSGSKEQEEKNLEVLQKFLNDEIKVIVSTVKLGMGFDKGNVAFVIHFQCPKNVIAYYQQIGRAGRNIKFARTFLMLGREDYLINKGFIDRAFPSESDMKRVRQYITACPNGCTLNKLCAAIDLPKKTLSKILDFLEDGGLIEKEWKFYNGTRYASFQSTPAPFSYRRDHYERIKEIRYRELEQIQAIANTDKCLNRTVVSCLDDVEDHDCGVCSNCDPQSRFPLSVSDSSKKKALAFLVNITIPIEPWNYWPQNNLVPRENKYPNLQGIALSRYNEGLGKLVKDGKYSTHRFHDLLVQKGVNTLKKYVRKLGLTCITAVPSLNTDVVPDYAKRLAAACGLPYIPLLRKTNRSHQKDMNNTSHQFENAYQSFEVISPVKVPAGVVLVDDMVDSGLTLAVCGALLLRSGCERVFSMALADSGTGGKDDEDDE